jgi:hypothetical protein
MMWKCGGERSEEEHKSGCELKRKRRAACQSGSQQSEGSAAGALGH